MLRSEDEGGGASPNEADRGGRKKQVMRKKFVPPPGQEKLFGPAMFRVVSEYLYPEYERTLDSDSTTLLYAYNQQATVGPNLEGRPSCFLSFFGSKSANLKWQTWANLGRMTKTRAMKAFMETVYELDPSFMVRFTLYLSPLP